MTKLLENEAKETAMNSNQKPDQGSHSTNDLQGLHDAHVGVLGAIIVDADGRIEGVNTAARELLRVNVDAFVCRPLPALLARLRTDLDEKHIMQAVRHTLRSRQADTFELQLDHGGTAQTVLKVHISAICNGDVTKPHAMLTLEDITLYRQVGLSGQAHEDARRYVEMVQFTAYLEQQKEQYRLQSIHDGLTGVYNYAHFRTLLADEVLRARRYGHPLALLMIDIDDFKAYNDAHGHAAGNWALQGVAGLLQHECRRTDQVARYGGEEFAIILPETDGREALRLAKRLRRTVENQTRIRAEFRRPITVSIGVANYPEDTDDHEERVVQKELIAWADEGLYRAKAEGKNCVREAERTRRKASSDISGLSSPNGYLRGRSSR